MVGAGAVVTASVPPHAIVVGNPARIVGYTSAMETPAGNTELGRETLDEKDAIIRTPVEGVSLHRLSSASDMRGSLVAGEFGANVPFEVKRFFMVFDVPSEKTRGQHAHRKCHQFLIAAHGRVAVVVDDGARRSEITLDSRAKGLHIPPMIWGTQYKYSADAVLLVLASEPYDPADYIRDYEQFCRERSPSKS
jgi:dTDP-4-dehydrorhamnose 3,5-epimerase-like enzyme